MHISTSYRLQVLPVVLAALPALTYAQHLDKPPLDPSLDYLQSGLMAHLPSVGSSNFQWDGWILQDCASIAQNAGLDPADVSTFNVTYSDCGDPWLLCRHKDSPSPLDNMIDLLGRVPVHMRQWVRHMIALPDPNGGHAFNSGGNIAMFNIIDGDVSVFLHETGHSLDLLGAYADKPLSSSENWLSNYNQDSNTPDPYAATNQVENVAQNTVVATFNENVPGGLASVEPHYMGIFHQYTTLQTAADDADPGQILKPGGQCTHRLQNSAAVRGGAPKTPTVGDAAAGGIAAGLHGGGPRVSRVMMRERRDVQEKPDVSLSGDVTVIEPKEFDTREHCKHTW